jgi:hypothetical protein
MDQPTFTRALSSGDLVAKNTHAGAPDISKLPCKPGSIFMGANERLILRVEAALSKKAAGFLLGAPIKNQKYIRTGKE